MRDLTRYILEEDLLRILQTYREQPPEVLKIPTDRFVGSIEFRIYTEWCTDKNSRKIRDGEWFSDYINEETHHQLVRERLQWNEDKKRFDELSPEQYRTVRNKALDGLVRSSIDFFRTGGIHRTDNLNLRRSLAPYIQT